MFSPRTEEPNVRTVPIINLVCPCLFHFCCYFLIITPSRHCLPIETVSKWVENSVRFTSAMGTADTTNSLKKKKFKRNKYEFFPNFQILLSNNDCSWFKMWRYKLQLHSRPTCYFCLNRLHKCLRKRCPIISFFVY